MNESDFFVQPGERALICGHTGSGKSVLLAVQARGARNYPVVVYDTKGDDQFFDVPMQDEKVEVVETYSSFEKLTRAKRKDLPTYIIVRPVPTELADVETLDAYLSRHYDALTGSYALVDEAYQWHTNGRAGPGLIGMLTRGRQRRITTILCTQRPVYLSRFCLTESQKLFVYNLMDRKDRARLADVMPVDPDAEWLPDYHFRYYKVGTREVRLIAPVDPLPHRPEGVPRRVRWL